MNLSEYLGSIQEALSRRTIFQRIVIANAAVIVVGVSAGMLIAWRFPFHAVDWKIIVVAVLVTILIGNGINFWLVSAALRPLRDLGRLVKRLQNESVQSQVSPIEELRNADPFTVRMANTLYSLFVHLEEQNQELRALSERAISAQEAERKAIAQSLHDDTGQALTMLAIHLDRIDERIPASEQGLKKLVDDAKLLTASSLAELRRILAGLRPAILDDLGLVPAIRWYARTHLEAAGVHVILKAPDPSLQLPPAIATTLFRITQEAINNIVRHAHASTASIILQVDETEAHLQIEDNGAGFNQERVSLEAVPFNQLGLVGIRERAQLLAGKVIIRSAPGKGSQLSAIIPLHPDTAGEYGEHKNSTG